MIYKIETQSLAPLLIHLFSYFPINVFRHPHDLLVHVAAELAVLVPAVVELVFAVELVGWQAADEHCPVVDDHCSSVGFWQVVTVDGFPAAGGSLVAGEY